MSNTPTKIDLVKSRCILVTFSAGYYNWVRRDRKAEREYAASKGLRLDAYQAHKNLFVGTDALLASAKSLVNESRAYHYNVTYPWKRTTNEAIIANGLVPDYRKEIIGFQNRMDQLNAAISTEWDSMVNEARRIFGPAFDESQYPSLGKVVISNYIKVNFSPVSSGDDIRSSVDTNDPVLDEIRDEVTVDTQRALDATFAAIWERIYDVIKVANTNLQKHSSDDGRFRTEWHDTLSLLVGNLQHFSTVMDDPRLDEIREMASRLVDFDPEDLQDDIYTRQQASKQSQEIFDKVSSVFSAFGGK